MKRKKVVKKTETQRIIPKLKALTEGQQEYIDCINKSQIILCTGVAGTGKSYIAVGRAVELLKDYRNGFEKIVLVRPLMECGNRLGALPGDLDEKVGPYMQHFENIFGDFLTLEEIEYYHEEGVISIEPLELMRGRTFKKTLVILDEAQNCTKVQLLMFLTRFGDGSKMIVCGDENQSDVKEWEKYRGNNAFAYICDKLDDSDDSAIEGITVVELTEEDIVRHHLVKALIKRLG